MKKIFFTTLICIIGFTALFAQIPYKFNYQGVARGANGQALANQSIGLRISILSDSASGQAQYAETHTITTNAYGLYTLAVGSGTALSGDMYSVDWDGNSKFMFVEMDPTGGTNYIPLGTNQLLSVPYAIQADHAMYDNDNQTLSLSGNTLEISGGNSITLPSSSGLSGSGTVNQIPKFTATSTLGNSQVFDNGTRIGFGTATPSAKFDFAGGNGWDLINSDGDLKIGDNFNKLKMGIALGGGGAGWAGIVATNNLGLGTGTTAGTQATMNLSNGRVGIGTQNPAFKLHVVNTATGGVTSYFSANSTAIIDSGIVRAEYTGTTNLDHVAIVGSSLHNGFVASGIGVNALGGYQGIAARAANGSTSSTYGGTIFAYSNGTAYGVYGYATYTTNATAGIKYGVYGSAVGGTSSYGIYCSGNGGYTGTWTQVSDIKLKKNIEPMASALSKIVQLKVYNYEFKTDDPQYAAMHLDKGIHHGYISQELEQIMPELVRNDVMVAPGEEKGKETTIEYKGVNYIEMVPILTKGMQEQQEIIESQRAANEAQQQTIQEQSNLIQHMEQAIRLLEQRIDVLENKQR